MRYLIIFSSAIFCLIFLFISSAWSTIYLPPTGYPLSKTYEDFESYSVTVLKELNSGDYGYPSGSFSSLLDSSGSGKLDLVATSFNQSSDNSVYGDFDDAVINENPSFHGNWSGYLDDLLKFLYVNNAYTPVFMFDLNETGSNSDLYVTARVYLTENSTGEEVGVSWSFDNGFEDYFESGYLGYDSDLDKYNMDTSEMVYVPKDIEVDVDGDNEIDFTVANSLGSGNADFFVYAPEMNLWQYQNSDYRFNIEFNFAGTDSGGEEIYLTAAYQPTPVPEPSSMILFGLGVTTLAYMGRRFRK